MAAQAKGPAGGQQADFQHRKRTFLAKDDKSSAGGIDAHAQEVCRVINEREDVFTTSSCSGRAFLWRGEGVKSTSHFERFRVTHELIVDAEAYFNLATLAGEAVDAAWEEQAKRTRTRSAPSSSTSARGTMGCLASAAQRLCAAQGSRELLPELGAVWLRFEPFILHVCCRDLEAAAGLLAAARSVFKTMGLQSWSAEGKYMVAIWGDEGLEMALSCPEGRVLFGGQADWLAELVNCRHRRNWAKIDRFTDAVRSMREAAAGAPSPEALLPADDATAFGDDSMEQPHRLGPRHFDVIGDVAVLHAVPAESDKAAVGAAVLAANKKQLRLVVARRGPLQGDARAPGGLELLAGPDRRPLITTHSEFGVQYMVDLNEVFFSPRMAAERQRLCTLVQPGEHVCVLFAGCGPEALQIADKTEAEAVVAVELNPAAVRCARRGLDLLARRQAVRAARVEIVEADATVLPEAWNRRFHRILAPRPKAHTAEEDDELAKRFLCSLLPLLRSDGVCHWYDFVADWELPACVRSAERITQACCAIGRSCSVLRTAPANSKPVAERQYRAVIDFSVA